jgi:very-short-patch-repair endonuclease
MGDGKNWWTVDVVREHVAKAADQIARYEAASFESFMEMQLGDDTDSQPQWRLGMESPLEAIFYVWWEAMIGRSGFYGSMLQLEHQSVVTVAVSNYRLDFVISFTEASIPQGKERPKIAVEVDGHAFHEKTREQVAYRNQRDRALQQAGWIVLHFSWSEMTTRPEICIGEVLGVVKDKIDWWHRKAGE